MSAELILAAIGAADLCLKYGKELIEACRPHKSAINDIRDKALIVEAIWSRTAIQIEFAQRVLKTQALPEDHCRIHIDVFETLKNKLMTVVGKLESVAIHDEDKTTRRVLGKMKYILLRDVLEAATSDIERWHRIFDPTWFLVLRVGDTLIDSELDVKRPSSSSSATSSLRADPSQALTTARNLRGSLSSRPLIETHVSLPESGLNWGATQTIAFSSTRIIQRKDRKGNNKAFAVDTISCDPSLNLAAARTDAESLAKKLKHVDPTMFGILSCHGLVKRKDRTTSHLDSIHLIFNLPLTHILNIARQLASAVSLIHTCEFVHKNIRPETILIFPGPETGVGLGSAYILGFDSFRSVNFQTLRRGDAAWHRNLYRHPLRQGIRARDSYVMQHDVYSLGVCLLELGLWESLVRYDYSPQEQEQEQEQEHGVAAEFQEKTEEEREGEREAVAPLPSKALGLLPEDLDLDNEQGSPPSFRIKDHLVILARTRLPLRMGDKYAAVVRICLECLDADNEDFTGDEAEGIQDEDGVLVGTRFIEKVIFRLDEISL